MTAELYTALAPWVTVWPATPQKLNIHTAPAMVLRSLGEDDSLLPLSLAEAESLVEYRKENGFSDLDDFFAHPVLADRAEGMTALRGELAESSSFFLLRATVEVADRHTQLYSVLERDGRQVNVLMRSAGGL